MFWKQKQRKQAFFVFLPSDIIWETKTFQKIYISHKKQGVGKEKLLLVFVSFVETSSKNFCHVIVLRR